MTRIALFTNHVQLMMHLSSIGSVGIGANPSATLSFEDQEVYAITVDLAPQIERETINMAKQCGFDIEVMDFERGQLVLVPTPSSLDN